MQILGVSSLTRYLRDLLDSDYRLQSLWIEGEVSNFRRSPAGHCYFTLKDDQAQLKCAWFCNSISSRARLPRDGDLVVAHGRVGVYENRGEYQLYVNLVQPAGVGALALQLDELRARLEREGLFDQTRKRPLPRFPRVVGIVTSPIGAVIQDFLNVVSRRYPGVEVVLAPTPVQGAGAAPAVAEAIDLLNAVVKPDAIVLARGGGSIEDLWCFNDEGVARAIFGSHAPIISGVGHETDWTIADLVADVRAPTPSAAAELLVPDRRECAAQLLSLRARMQMLVREQIEDARHSLGALDARLTHLGPASLILERRQAIDSLAERALTRLQHRFALGRSQLLGRARHIEALNPRAILARGYSITRDSQTGDVVRSVDHIYPGALLEVQVRDGIFPATVNHSLWCQAAIPMEGAEHGA